MVCIRNKRRKNVQEMDRWSEMGMEEFKEKEKNKKFERCEREMRERNNGVRGYYL